MSTSSTAPGVTTSGGTRTDPLTGGVVVGYEGTWHSTKALERAATEAIERGLPLTVLTVVATEPDPQLSDEARRAAATDRWDAATTDAAAGVAAMRRRLPGLSATAELVPDVDPARPQGALAQARLLVVGTAGRAGRKAFLIGSTSRELARAVTCPVLVVPETTPLRSPDDSPDDSPGAPDSDVVTGSVVVGLRHGAEAVGLLRLAADEAARRAVRLCVVHAYPLGRTPGQAQADVDLLLRQAALAHTVHVTTIVTPDPPAEALLGYADLAGLLVVGTRGPLAMARLALDSVSRAVLDAADVPVLLVPDAVSLAAAQDAALAHGATAGETAVHELDADPGAGARSHP